MNIDVGHWIYPVPFDPEHWFGFVYRIIDTATCREYIGRKQFYFRKSKRLKGRTNKVWKSVESDWRKYTSSSETINSLIEAHGKERFKFFIESMHTTKASLSYAEVERLIVEDVLRAKLPNGTKKYYNGIIPAVKFTPPAETAQEECARLYTLKKEKLPNDNFSQVTTSIVTRRTATPVKKPKAPKRPVKKPRKPTHP